MLYTDRTRVEKGFSCGRRRWYEFHSLGTGIQPRRLGLPKVVGIWTHKGVEAILSHAYATGLLPSRTEVGTVLSATVNGFWEEATRKGLEEARNETQLNWFLNEQSCLIEGLGWAAYRVFMPWLLENYSLVGVEDEFNWITGCDCGLEGAGELKDHQERNCSGLVIPVRGDIVARNKQSGRLEVFDWKTSSYGADYSDAQHMLQMLFTCRGVSWRYEEEVALHWIVNLMKGKIDRAKEEGELDRQNSPLCYAWFKASDPPFEKFEISTKYTAKKGFNRAPLWEALEGMAPEGMSKMEWWVMERLSEGEVRKLVEPVGPATRYSQEHEISVLEEVFRQESYYDALEISQKLEHPEDELPLPLRTWNCRPYGQHYPCPYLGLCLDREEERDSHWEKRVPHHEVERDVRDFS